ncbi:DUF4160 domain-containing protein [Limosilactobacillus reuteri]|uniref:DUF4160 domain-containing protein n=1 Tax=Limosilactobacillus reuteri TaxID=1598 RepID=UPI0021A6315B|nr:DUF4160 domain-containing protein [Limosilactobacillus reuteri]
MKKLPNLINFLSYCMYFWSNEGNEPAHIHVAVKRPSPVSVKFWLLQDGSVKLADNKLGLSKKEIKRLKKFLVVNYDDLLSAWKDYFEEDTVKFYK